MLYDVAVEVAVVGRLAVVEGKGDDRNSMAVGDMEDPAAVVVVHSLSVGCTDDYRHGLVDIPLDSVDDVVVAASEKSVMLVKVLVQASGDR